MVYFRCGDIATTFANSYGFLHPDWLRGFLPTLVNDAAADYVLLLGNRGSHGDQRSRTLCEGYFGELKKHVASMTSKPVLVAPEGFDDDNARWGIIRDIRCMTQSAALVDYTYASSFGYVASLLHNGCASVIPHFEPGAKAGKTPPASFQRPPNPRARLVTVGQRHLVKKIPAFVGKNESAVAPGRTVIP